MSIIEHLIPELHKRFSNRDLKDIDDAPPYVVFPGRHAEVGDLRIFGDGNELTVCVGTHGHIHFNTYDGSLSVEEEQRQITSEVIEFLEQMFADRIVMWGMNAGAGGFGDRGDALQHNLHPTKRQQEFVWSGPLPS